MYKTNFNCCLYGRETLFLTLKEERRLRGSGNGAEVNIWT